MKPAHVVYVVKGAISELPPCASHILALRSAGFEVTLVHGPSDRLVLDRLRTEGVELIPVADRTSKSRIARARHWAQFRRDSGHVLDRVLTKDSVLWVGTGDTALALSDWVLRSTTPFVLSLLELYDTVPAYRAMLGPLARRAGSVVVAQETRGQIMANWWDLRAQPVVIPNSPFGAPRARAMAPTTRESAEALARVGQHRILLYQGLVSPERDLRSIALATRKIPGIRLAVMGRDYEGHLSEIRECDPDLLYLDPVPAPAHLEVTSHATIGIATYKGHSLNTLFCAPNKIYEYAAFGLPILGNDVPGLRLTVESSGAGMCVDTTDPLAVQRAVQDMLTNYLTYSRASTRLFEDTDPVDLTSGAVLMAMAYRRR